MPAAGGGLAVIVDSAAVTVLGFFGVFVFRIVEWTPLPLLSFYYYLSLSLCCII